MRQHSTVHRRLVRMVLVISSAVLVLACTAILSYEFVSVRQDAARRVSTLGQIVAANTTAALAFQNQDDANTILKAIAIDKPVVAVVLYDNQGKLFAQYPSDFS